MMFHNYRLLMVAVLVASFLVGSTTLVLARPVTPANQYGPVTVTVTSQCPSGTQVVNLPIDPTQLPSITVSGFVNGNVHLYDKDGNINRNVNGSAPYSFTSVKSDLLSACLNSGTSATVTFQGQLNEFSNTWAGYAVQGFNPSPNRYSMVEGTWHVPAVSCSFNENSGSATWIGLGGAPNAGSMLIEQIGTYQNCAVGVPIFKAAYMSVAGPSSSSVPILYPCSDSNYSSCIVVHKGVNAGDEVEAYVQYMGSGNFRLFIHDGTQKWHYMVPQTQPDSSVRYTAEWIEETSPNGLANFHSVTFNNCYVDHQYMLSIAGPIIQNLTMGNTAATARRATPSGLGGNTFSVNFNSQ